MEQKTIFHTKANGLIPCLSCMTKGKTFFVNPNCILCRGKGYNANFQKV